MAGLHASKPVFCEWPLGANLAEAQEMATSRRSGACKTMVGLQARSDPTLMYARDLIGEGLHRRGADGEPERDQPAGARARRGPHLAGRPQERRQHVHDHRRPRHRRAVLHPGRVRRGRARLSTRIKAWQSTETGQDVPVDSPDSISVAGVLKSGAEVSVHIAACHSTPAARAWRSTAATGRWCSRRRGP